MKKNRFFRFRLILLLSTILVLIISSIIISCSYLPIATQIAIGNIEDLQKRIDFLEKKAIKNESFSQKEKEFCINIFDSLAFGGSVMGYSEASKMLSHYIHGNGTSMQMDSSTYIENMNVKNECRKLLLQIEKEIRENRWHEKRKFTSPTLNIRQDEDPKLFYLSNVFEIRARAKKIGKNRYQVFFEVKRYYEFPSYAAQMKRFNTPKHFISYFPTSVPGKTLTIDDGLSKYLSQIGIAKEFDYFTHWEEELTLF